MIRVFTKEGDLKTTNVSGGGNPYNINIKTSSLSSLTLTTGYTVYIFTGTSPTTWTLPDVSSNINSMITCINRGTSFITLNSNSGGNDIFTTTPVSSVIIVSGEKFNYICDSTYWNEL